MTALKPLMFTGPERHKVEREVIERHRAACGLCEWRGEWIVTSPSNTISGADITASGDMARHAAESHGVLVLSGIDNG